MFKIKFCKCLKINFFNFLCFIDVVHHQQASIIDNAENASVCSWEAVEEQRGISTSVGSNGSGNLASSVLWVPDHAVSQCTSCQTEFWLGRRKHHCRFVDTNC